MGVKVEPAASDKDVLQKAAESAAKKSEGTGDTAKVEKVVVATEKEAAAADQIKTWPNSTLAAAGSAVAATATAPGAAIAAVADTSKKAEKLAEKADEATAAKTDVKVQLVDYSTQLMGERTSLTDRLKLVLDKFEAKGGDEALSPYIASIGGIKIDVTDRTATLARISGWLTSEEADSRLARDVETFLAYIIGSIIAAKLVRMILRRVMARDHVTSHLFHDFVVSSSGRVIVAIGFLLALSALEVNLAPPSRSHWRGRALSSHSPCRAPSAISPAAFSSWSSSHSTSATLSTLAAASRARSPTSPSSALTSARMMGS